MTINHIKDLKPDPQNARAHTPRNVGMIEKALGEVGAARSIVMKPEQSWQVTPRLRPPRLLVSNGCRW